MSKTPQILFSYHDRAAQGTAGNLVAGPSPAPSLASEMLLVDDDTNQ